MKDGMPDSQAELEELLDSHIQSQTGNAVKAAVADVLSRSGAKRLPVAEYNEDALGASEDGKWKSKGEFFQKVFEAGNGFGIDSRLMHTRNLGENFGDTGGFLVPEEFRPDLMQIPLEQSVIRPRAFTMPMGSNVLRIPSIKDTSHASNLFGGVSASWGSEGEDISSSTNQPAFGQVVLDAKKLTGYTVISNELVQDSAIAIETLLSRLFGQAISYFEDVAFISGTGAGQPQGVLNSECLISVAKETGQAATTIVKENLDKMYSRMLPSSLGNSVWLAHNDTFPQLASLSQAVGTGGGPVWVSNVAGGPPNSIYGRPIIFTEKCKTLGTVGDLMLVDLSYYLIGDRQALTTSASPHVRFTTQETVFLFSERLDGRMWLDSALTPRNGSNTVSPAVALATRS
ncbi:HK97 family major capsid protein [uncultured Mediterranean phage uvDeep-CGR2-KM21-C338]|nr:HK97 family major capsid protein [uncultured Mediterranean phage uvDeep-CGR2-KM21-C338]